MNAKVNPVFWADKGVEELDAGGKLAALWILTNPHTNLVGYCPASPKRFAFETGLPECVLMQTAKSLPLLFKVGANGILVLDHVTKHFGSNDNLQRNNLWKSIAAAYLAVDDGLLREYLLHKHSDFIVLEASNRSPSITPLARTPQGGSTPPMRMRNENEHENELFRDKEGCGEKKGGKRQESKMEMFPLNLQSKTFRESWEQWKAFRKSKGKPISELAAKKQLDLCSSLGEQKAIEMINSSIANDYQGLFAPKNGAGPSRNGPNYNVPISNNSEDFKIENQMRGLEHLMDPNHEAKMLDQKQRVKKLLLADPEGAARYKREAPKEYAEIMAVGI